MSQWLPTAALGRATLVAASGLTFAVVFGSPVLLILAAPLTLFAAMGLRHMPSTTPAVQVDMDHHLLHEGQGTVSRLTLTDDEDVEHVARVYGDAPYIALQPSNGVVGQILHPSRGTATGRSAGPEIHVSPRRWGPRRPAAEKVALTTAWAAWRWGPLTLIPPSLYTLPAPTPFDATAEMPQPVGLVGAHQSRRVGNGTEFSSIRPFQSGDRLRRINWRISLRTGDLHVVSTRNEEDNAVLLVVDALADYGTSGGIDGDASSLDLSIRAAAAVAQHFGQTGDRVGLRTIGTNLQSVSFGSGARHHRILLSALARTRSGRPPQLSADRLPLHATAGTVVMIFSPLLDEAVTTLAATLLRRGLPVIVLDTLPTDADPAQREGLSADVADLAWRMRKLERATLLDALSGAGCPVITWRGPGTLDEVLRRLARRSQLPQASSR